MSAGPIFSCAFAVELSYPPRLSDLRRSPIGASGLVLATPRASPEHEVVTLLLRSLVVGAAAVAAYYYSLATLIRGLLFDSPLAYLGLVPIIAVGLAIARGLAPRSEPDIHDRHVDYIIGLPLIALALALELVLPIQKSTFFWLWRLDLLSFPFFVAGAICLVFGLRGLWRLRFPVAFLFLAWPLPYSTVLNGVLAKATDVTAAVVSVLVRVIPLAQPAPGFDGSVFAVSGAGNSFVVAIASACSGVNGVVGFLLIGIAFGFLVYGRALPKVMWLVGGMLLVWILNIVRILTVFAVGRIWGEQIAIDWVHPIIGLLFFNVGVLAMLLVMGRFGLSFKAKAPERRRVASAPQTTPRRSLAVDRAGFAVVVIVVAAAVGMFGNSRMEQYELLARDLGTPRLSDLSVANAAISGWSLGKVGAFTWAPQYFGPQSSWTRYEYDWQSQPEPASRFQSNEPVVMDVISTKDLSTFATYGLEACYQFHRYRVMDARTIALSGGVSGHVLTYFNPALNSDWIAVYWEWPVVANSGYRYERVVLSLLNPVGERLVSPPIDSDVKVQPQLAVNDWLLGSFQGRLSPDLASARNFLVAFAQEVVISAAVHSGQT